MKNLRNKITVLTVMAVGLLLFSCDTGEFLNAPVLGSLNEDVVVATNERGVNALLVGAYAALDGQNIAGGPWETTPTNWIYGAVAGGMAHKGSTSGDQPPINSIARMEHNASNGFFNSKWKALYEGVNRTNTVLHFLKQVPEENMTEEQKVPYRAEARFLRAHYYFELKKMFGNVPWIDENTTDFSDPNSEDFKVPNDTDIWPNIEADFQFAFENLPGTQTEVGRANKWAAGAYLGKTYLYQKKWEEAKTIFDDVITNGTTSDGTAYELVDDYSDIFRAATEQNSGTVFSVQYVGPNDGTGTVDNSRQGDMLNFPYSGPFTCCGFFQPTHDLVNSYQTDGGGLPMPDSYNDSEVEHDRGVGGDESFTPHTGNLDPRLDWAVGRRGMPYHDWGPFAGVSWVRDPANGGPFHAKKHVYWKATADQYGNNNEWAPGSAINYPVIRFADVLLMAAEAEVELGNLNAARLLVNQVRARVADDTYGDGWVDQSLNEPFAAETVGSDDEMTALTDVEAGDWVIRTDKTPNSTYVLLEEPASEIDNWQEYTNPNYVIAEYPAVSLAFASQPAAREAVHFERKLELSLEGHRFFDLVRWGEADEKLNAFYAYEGGVLGYPDVDGASFTTGKNEYYPIPQRQIDLSIKNGEPTLQQNDNY